MSFFDDFFARDNVKQAMKPEAEAAKSNLLILEEGAKVLGVYAGTNHKVIIDRDTNAPVQFKNGDIKTAAIVNLILLQTSGNVSIYRSHELVKPGQHYQVRLNSSTMQKAWDDFRRSKKVILFGAVGLQYQGLTLQQIRYKGKTKQVGTHTYEFAYISAQGYADSGRVTAEQHQYWELASEVHDNLKGLTKKEAREMYLEYSSSPFDMAQPEREVNRGNKYTGEPF